MGSHTQLLLPRASAAAQAGLFDGKNPSTYNPSDPIVLWIIQIVIIMAMIQFLSLLFRRLRQPRVIAEILGGVFLGPTVLGRIPNFTNRIFPTASVQGPLTLTANIGLVFFLFIVGVEIDASVVKKHYKSATAISVAGLIVPLGLGAAIGVPIYREFTSPSINFGFFLLFTAVSVGITAFPVLCRILTELKLLDTTVGNVTLAAGVGNDVVGWILLALTVALVDSSTGLVALYVLLTAVGFVLFLLFPVKYVYRWLAIRSGSLEQGHPTMMMMTVTILIILSSAFFTDIIGIHPIFGGFLAGLLIPHTNGYGVALTEKIEDLITILFLPLYFALTGLNTNLGSLDTGKSWGYTILLIVVSFSGKFLACSTAAKFSGFSLRESAAVGSLMSCKGLVELIVLNVGLSAGILDTQTFSMFVVHAIILTFITTPLVLLFYPERHRVSVLEGDAEKATRAITGGTRSSSDDGDELTTKFGLVIDQIDQLPAAMTVTQLLCPSVAVSEISSQQSAPSFDEKTLPTIPYTASPIAAAPISLTLFRLIELSNRTSTVLKSHLAHSDPVVSVFKTFAWILGSGFRRLQLKVDVNIVNKDEFSDVVRERAQENVTGMIVIPWASGTAVGEETSTEVNISGVKNPFDGVFHSSSAHEQIVTSVSYSEFIRKTFLTAPCDVALFVDRGLAAPSAAGVNPESLLVLPFFGGPDDRLALKVLVKICAGHEGVRAVAVKVQKSDGQIAEDDYDKKMNHDVLHTTVAGPDTVYGNISTGAQLASETADNLIWERYSSPSQQNSNPALTSALSRITFTSIRSPKPLQSVVEFFAGEEVGRIGRSHVVAVIGRSRRMAVENLDGELEGLQKGLAMGSAVKKTLGNVGAALVATGVNASLLVVQACLASGSS